jgi:hypothetical protein
MHRGGVRPGSEMLVVASAPNTLPPAETMEATTDLRVVGEVRSR